MCGRAKGQERSQDRPIYLVLTVIRIYRVLDAEEHTGSVTAANAFKRLFKVVDAYRPVVSSDAYETVRGEDGGGAERRRTEE
jgi:hypothetical protein